MIEDVYEPLARYRDEFREKFATLAREKFNELTDRSGIDVAANRTLVAEIKKLQRKADSASGKKVCYGWLMALGFVGALVALVWVLGTNGSDSGVYGWCAAGMIAGLALGIAMWRVFRSRLHPRRMLPGGRWSR